MGRWSMTVQIEAKDRLHAEGVRDLMLAEGGMAVDMAPASGVTRVAASDLMSDGEAH